MLNDIKAVLFDLDGTLIDSMSVWKDIDIEFLGNYGIELPADLQNSIEGMSFTETADYFRKRFQFKESVEEIKAIWNEMAYEHYTQFVKLKDGVLDFLSYLKSHNIRTGISTSNSIELVQGVLKAKEIEPYFDVVVTACQVNAGKPSPDIYLETARLLNVEPKDCLVFEDIPMGIMAGKNANMKVCTIYDDFSKNQDIKKRSLADYYINTFKEVLEGTYEVLMNE
ncbi:HAD family hydrolase [Candidatus Galacturonibacter soehngenii]|uniref:HAD family phosphatase n=1 Tax=Candidatus Galacturonatibacter soehngenii TaxID=2307010 RepID=A0A7V7QMN9_9FIRM|nr:HAD family phosphatase [Candidatus Galacturonibacter soehngenii]KAB1439548.1 HAD family phosphatase [Candidatus Galacturonibacter soehngenii]MBA4687065.1 HAD family phosphatase [Candidatus Galacturonibacter soehngenii]